MNKIIQEQLKKTVEADLSNFDESTQEYFIPQKKETKFEIDHVYLIKLTNEMNNPYNSINTNWNNGNRPTFEYCKIDVSRIMGRMLYVNAIVYDNINNVDLDDIWTGWISRDLIEVIKEL